VRPSGAEFVGKYAAKDFGGEIVPDLSAKRTPNHNPRIRHGAHRCRDILTALLAADGEVALTSFRNVEHEGEYRRIKGETSRGQLLEILLL
jgi:hypothetical protein